MNGIEFNPTKSSGFESIQVEQNRAELRFELNRVDSTSSYTESRIFLLGDLHISPVPPTSSNLEFGQFGFYTSQNSEESHFREEFIKYKLPFIVHMFIHYILSRLNVLTFYDMILRTKDKNGRSIISNTEKYVHLKKL